MKELRLTAAIAFTLLLLSWIAAPVVGHTQSVAEIASIRNNAWEKIFVTSCKTIIGIADSSDNPEFVYNIIEYEDIDQAYSDPEDATSVMLASSLDPGSSSMDSYYSTDITDELEDDEYLLPFGTERSSPQCTPIIPSNNENTGSNLPVIDNTSFPSNPASVITPTNPFEEPSIDQVIMPPYRTNPITTDTNEIQIEYILQFFDSSVENGDLQGKGPAKSAENRKKVVRKTIRKAGKQLEKGHRKNACKQLQKAYKRCDGKGKQKDFVKGGAAPS